MGVGENLKEKQFEHKCIFCAKNSDDGLEHKITNEHVIPKVLGGWITLPILCKKCNNDVLGRQAESQLKQNAYIVSAIDKLNIKPRKKAYHHASISISFDNDITARAIFNDSGSVKLRSTIQPNGSIIVPNENVKADLKKMVKRSFKTKGISAPNIDKIYNQAQLDVLTPIPGTGIFFKKISNSNGTINISNLNKPIPFIIPASIAFKNIAGFSYHFAIQKAFDPFRDWILDNNFENKVMVHTIFNQSLAPNTFNYQPIHYLRYSIIEDGLVCLVVLFNVLIFTVFMGFNPDLTFLPDQRLLDKYIVYDIKDRDLKYSIPPDAMVSEDSQFMETMYHLANYELRLKENPTISTSSV